MTDASNAIAAPTVASYPEIALKLTYPWVIVGVFALYWLTFLMLEGHNGLSSFGADTILYTAIPYGTIDDRLTRFHPAIIGMAVLWVKIVSPLFAWVAPHHLLAALFAAIGAAGVRAALTAFEVLVPRRCVILCGLVYAFSLGIWYFSGIAESKILTATLTTIYIALYLRLRRRWTLRGALLLTGVLAFACLNEIVSAFLVAIPAVDTLIRRGIDLRAMAWIFAHSLVAPAALFILEVIVHDHLANNSANLESGSSLSMFWFYAQLSDHSLSSVYAYLINWLFFTIAAPSAHAYAATPIWPTYFGYFEPSFAGYFDDVTSISLIALFALMVAGSLAPGWRAERPVTAGIVLPLAAFSAVRAAFFLVFNPAEVMLFSSAITLPHLIILLVPFIGSRFPAKTPVLACFAALLFANNLRFMIG